MLDPRIPSLPVVVEDTEAELETAQSGTNPDIKIAQSDP